MSLTPVPHAYHESVWSDGFGSSPRELGTPWVKLKPVVGQNLHDPLANPCAPMVPTVSIAGPPRRIIPSWNRQPPNLSEKSPDHEVAGAVEHPTASDASFYNSMLCID